MSSATFLPVRYALRDLRGALGSFRVVLMCLVLGVAAIASVQFISRSVLDSIERDGRTILGADIIVRNLNAPAPAGLQEWFQAQQGILSESIETRVMLSKASTLDNTLVELKAVDGAYPLYGVFETDAGNDLHALLSGGGVILDPALRDRLQVRIGERVKLGNAQFTVRGFITHEPDRAGGARFGLAPRVVLRSADMPATGLVETGSMVAYDLRVKFPENAAGSVNFEKMRAALEKDFPKANWRITDADNASPRITSFINRLMLFLTMVGLSALLIGGIGIGNGIRAHLETRIRTIAVLKTLGAAPGMIERMFACQIALVGILGTVLGLLLGMVVPFVAMPMLSGLLPFSVQPVLSVAGVVVPLVFGLLVTFVFALWPLGEAVRSSALELFRSAAGPARASPDCRFKAATFVLGLVLAGLAIGSARDTQFAMWFVVGALFCLVVFWLLGHAISLLAKRMRAPRNPALRLGLRNLHRPGNATANTLVSLGLGLTVLMSVTLIELNLRDGIVQNLPKDAPAFFFLDIQRDQKDGFEKLLAAQPSAHTIKFSANLRGRIVSVNGVAAEEALKDNSERWLLQNDRGFTYADTMPAHSEILEGEWWPRDYRGSPLISVVEDVARGFDVGPGDRITVNILGRDITATIANVRSVNWMNFTINYAITFAPGTLESAPHGWLATVVADPAQEAGIQRNLGAAFPNITMIRLSDAVAAAGDILGNMATAVRAMAMIAVITGILVLAGSLAATRTQRLYDTVILKVLGIPNRTLVAGFLAEFGLLGLIAGSVSLGLGALISWAVLVPMMDLGWNFYLIPAVATGMAGFLLTLGIGWAVTGRVLSAPAAPYLRNE